MCPKQSGRLLVVDVEQRLAVVDRDQGAAAWMEWIGYVATPTAWLMPANQRAVAVVVVADHLVTASHLDQHLLVVVRVPYEPFA